MSLLNKSSLQIHALSDVQCNNIGEGTVVWQYAVILKGAQIGQNCNINCHTFIENDVVLGNNVTLKSGVFIWDGVVLEDNVFVGPNVTFTNDLRPRSKQHIQHFKTIVCTGASLGAGTVLLSGLRFGKYAMSGIGSVITNNVPDHALVYGNPAKIHGWVDETGRKLKLLENDIWISESKKHYVLTENGMKFYE